MFDDYFGISQWTILQRSPTLKCFPAPLKHTLESLQINKFKVAAFFFFCLWKLSYATTLSGDAGTTVLLLLFLLFVRAQKKIRKQNKWKIIIHKRPGKAKNRTEMTLASENLWDTEREKVFLYVWRFIECYENILRDKSINWERTDSLL